MTGFDTPFPPLFLSLIGLAVIAWALWKRPAAPPRAAWGLTALRAAGVILIVLLLLNPFTARRLPDASQFAVAVVADVSRSMETTDLPGQTPRLAVVQEALEPAADSNLWARLAQNYALEPSTVAREWQAGADWSARDGDTALGDGLRELLTTRSAGSPPLGAALLLSDGINLTGERVPDAAIAFREAGVPVSVAGVGEPAPPGDIGLAFANPPARSPLNDPLSLSVDATNQFPEDRRVEIELFRGDERLDGEAVLVPGGADARVTFDFLPEAPGLQVYRAVLKNPAAGDFNRTNDLDYASVEITLPQEQSLLYLSARLSPFWRYLQQALGDDDQMQRLCIVQTGEERFYRQGFGEDSAMDEAQLGFPEDGEEFFRHSVLIVDISAMKAMTPPAREGLRNYLLRRGGGVLFLGDPNEMPEDLRALLPVREGDLARVIKRTPIMLANQPVFSDADGGVLAMPPGPYLPKESFFFQQTGLSLGARVAAETEERGLPVLTVHAYGAGRAAYLGTESTWRWALTSDRENEQHRAFWRQLLTWLASGGKPRVEVPLQGEVVPLGSPTELDLTVRGSDFRPSENARVRAAITSPDGEILPEVDLIPQAGSPGGYTGEVLLDQPGEYKVDYAIEFPDDERLEHTAYFAARRAGRENEDLTFRENTLRDLARITGGDYFGWREMDRINQLPLAASVPHEEERTYWTRNAAFLFALLGVFGAEWFWRRNLGLR